ncbi:MAG: hypothetical protein GY754_44940 [bacterium]|nr:hypothetical protein [bacterium]
MNITEITSEKSLTEIKKIIQGLAGKTCWDARLSYGDELSLEIGEKVPYKSEKLKDKFKGEWSVGARASFWELLSDESFVVSADDDPDIVNEKISCIVDSVITKVDILFPSLTLLIEFNNTYSLMIIPFDEDEEEDEEASDADNISDWEIFTPGDMMLEMGPLNQYRYSSSVE